MRTQHVLLCLLTSILVLAPAAQAHATVKSDDGAWWITTGNLNEPVTTWTITGLDLSIRQVGPDDTRVEVEELNAHNTLSATIVAPGGEEMECPLRIQHGAVNRYSCAEAYYLTDPGQYVVRLQGDIDGSPVDGEYDIAGPLPAFEEQTFPASEPATLTELQAENVELRDRVVDLEARLAELEGERGVPGPGIALVAAALAVALVATRRRS